MSRVSLPIWETRVGSLGWEDPLEKKKATLSCILASEISWPKESSWLGSLAGIAKEPDMI